jgi:hypothetical protein
MAPPLAQRLSRFALQMKMKLLLSFESVDVLGHCRQFVFCKDVAEHVLNLLFKELDSTIVNSLVASRISCKPDW